MRRLRTLLALLCIAALCAAPASAHTHDRDEVPEAPTVSPWAQAEVEKALALGLGSEYLTQDYREPITRAQFRAVAMDFVAIQNHCDRRGLTDLALFYLEEKDIGGYGYKRAFSDGGDDDTAAYCLGVVAGRGDGTFDPDGLITRQEAAVMLGRAYTACGGTLTQAEEVSFPDKTQIADWAQESAAAMAGWKVMNGLEDGSFAPTGNYSVEQCLVTFLRLYQNAPVSRARGNVTPRFTYDQCVQYMEESYSNQSYQIASRQEGSIATLYRTELVGAPHAASGFKFLYREGGIKTVDLGVCNGFWAVDARMPLENPQFSEDGSTFTCTATISEDTVTTLAPDKPLHDWGVYHVTVDVDTCAYTLQREPLSA